METHFLIWHYWSRTANILVYNIWFDYRWTLFVIGLIYKPCLGPASPSTTSFLYPNISAFNVTGSNSPATADPRPALTTQSSRDSPWAPWFCCSQIGADSIRAEGAFAIRFDRCTELNIIIHKMAQLPLTLKEQAKRFHVIENRKLVTK